MLSVKGNSRAQSFEPSALRKYYLHIVSECTVHSTTIAGRCLAILRPLTAAPFR